MTQDLFTQCKEEIDLEAKSSTPIDDIAERLNRLKGRDTGSQVIFSSNNHFIFIFLLSTYFCCTWQESEIPTKSAKENINAITLDEIAQLLAQCKMEATESGKQPDFATVVW